MHVTATLAPQAGGPSKAAIQMCRALAKIGIQVSLFTTNLNERGRLLPFTRPATLPASPHDPLMDHGVEIRYFPVRWPSRYGFSPTFAGEIRRRVSEFDVVHVHSLYLFTTLVACAYSRKNDVPYILRPHGTLDPFLRGGHRLRKAVYGGLVERRNWDNAAAIHYTSAQEMEMARPLGIKAPGIVIPLGIDMEEFKAMPAPGEFKRRRGLEGKQLVVFIGRLSSQKGLDLLISAFAAVTKGVPSAHLVLAGPEEAGYGRRVRSWLKAAGIGDRTTLTGMLQGRTKLELLADTDVWVLPSHTENFGFAVVEAMACGLPVIVSKGVHLHHQIAAARAGLVVERECDALASAIVDVLGDRQLQRSLGSAAQELVASTLSWSRAASSLSELYEALIQGPPSPSASSVAERNEATRRGQAVPSESG